MEYKAVVKRKDDDELQHWKYIKRVKGKNGKWQYIYDEGELNMYKNNAETGMVSQRDGVKKKVTNEYKMSDELFDRHLKVTTIYGDKKHTSEHNEYSMGKLSRARAKGEKWLFDNIFNRKKKK